MLQPLPRRSKRVHSKLKPFCLPSVKREEISFWVVGDFSCGRGRKEGVEKGLTKNLAGVE
jgi:hypothetical protein